MFDIYTFKKIILHFFAWVTFTLTSVMLNNYVPLLAISNPFFIISFLYFFTKYFSINSISKFSINASYYLFHDFCIYLYNKFFYIIINLIVNKKYDGHIYYVSYCFYYPAFWKTNILDNYIKEEINALELLFSFQSITNRKVST